LKNFNDVPLINIDHHQDNSVQGTLNFIDAAASSTCQLLYWLMLAWNKNSIEKFTAEALLCGLLDDSIIFRSQLSDANTLLTASLLIEQGADFQRVKNIILTYKSPFVVRFWGMLLERARNISGKSVSLVSVSKRDFDACKTDESVLGGFVNFWAGLVNSDVVLLLVERGPGLVKGSFRSKKADVAAMAEALGGGGHKNAAGFEFNGTLKEAEQAFVSRI
jgi:phosphoesterase RecJ-like protein